MTSPPESRLQRDYVCIGLSSSSPGVPVLRDCDDADGAARWSHDPKSGALRHLESGKCLKVRHTSELVAVDCDGGDEGQGGDSSDLIASTNLPQWAGTDVQVLCGYLGYDFDILHVADRGLKFPFGTKKLIESSITQAFKFTRYDPGGLRYADLCEFATP